MPFNEVINFSVTVTPPVSQDAPVASSQSFDDSTDTLALTIDKPGTLRYVLDDGAASSPTQIINGKAADGTDALLSGSQAYAAGDTDFDIDTSSVSPDGTYRVSYITEDATGFSDTYTISVPVDNTDPVLTNVSAVTDFGSIFVNWDADEGDGRARAIAVPAGDTEPSKAQKLAGQNNAGSAAEGDSGLAAVTQSGTQDQLAIFGLTVGNSYDVYLVHEDSATNFDTAQVLAVTVADTIPGTTVDEDAQTYIFAVEAADGQTLEEGTRLAFDTLIKGCKTDSVWDAIKASAILAGARTLDGALTPLKGPKPTNSGFVSGDYLRKTGLKGDGSSYIITGRDNAAEAEGDQSVGVHLTEANSTDTRRGLIGSGFDTGTTRLYSAPAAGRMGFRSQSDDGAQDPQSGSDNATGFVGISRSSTSFVVLRVEGRSENVSLSSNQPTTGEMWVFSRGTAGEADARIAFYHQGAALDQTLLEARLEQLITDLDGAIV